jgi:hypothetical protein
MAKTVKSADLDFNTIKARLKDYFKSKSEFSSYDFDGAGLDNLLDVLAYNTHLNALTANFSINESFLTTSQLRSSMVSHAQGLGYTIRSRKSSKAALNLSLNLSGVVNRPATIRLAKDTTFSSSVDNTSFTFRTLEEYVAKDDGTGSYVFKTESGSDQIPVYEGTRKRKTFIAGEKNERQLYVIPDETIDRTTATVNVFDTSTSQSFISYVPLEEAIQINANTTVYSISEVPNGFYEINFGDGTSFGKSPEPGEKIVVDYISTKGPLANDATLFIPTSDITINGVDYSLITVTAVESSGGADKQTIESIRQLAPIAFASQKRLVTSLDYKAMIETNFPQVRDASVWSGDQNVPIDYGAVYMSLNFEPGISSAVQQTVKDAITTNYTNNLAVMSMTPKFVDPVYVFLECNVQFDFDPALTGNTLAQTEENIYQYIVKYFNTNLNTFDRVFRKSNMLTEIDALDASILSTTIDVKVQMRQDVTTGIENVFDLSYPCKIATPDDVFYRVQSTTFSYFTGGSNIIAQVKNRLNSTVLQIVDLDGVVLLDNCGQYSADDGTISISNLNPARVTGGVDFLKFAVTPQNENTVRPLRNYILTLDRSESSSTAKPDRQTTSLEVIL